MLSIMTLSKTTVSMASKGLHLNASLVLTNIKFKKLFVRSTRRRILKIVQRGPLLSEQ
jgi:hypothetical protein